MSTRQKVKVYALILVIVCLSYVGLNAQQPTDGVNSYRLSAVNKRFLPVPDTISCEAGRGIMVAANPDLDNDGKAEIIVSEYRDGGRELVFEVVGNDLLEYVWGSKRLNPGGSGGGPSARTPSVVDFDNDGKMEILFQIGYSSTDSLEKAQRGLYFYEFTGNDNDYGDEPILHLPFEEIDPLFANLSYGRLDNPIRVQDVDGDGKNEMLFTPRAFNDLETGNLYILEIDSGTFENGDANIRLEYKYTNMAKALDFGLDGYVPVNTAVGDIDNDGLNEIVIAGWTNFESGAGLGFLEVTDVDTYTPGSVIQISETSVFTVKGGLDIVDVNGNKAVIIAAGYEPSLVRQILAIDNIVSDAFISPDDVKTISDGIAVWGIMAIGDQDHGSGSDGFDIYVSREFEIVDIEYNGTGALTDPNSYTNHGRLGAFSMNDTYDERKGFFSDIYTYPGMDIDNDGNRDIVVGYKGACETDDGGDYLGGEAFWQNTFNIFVFEWGDSTQSIPITLTTDVANHQSGFTIITPDDYQLEQNYPNPFNPTTNITFDLPLNKNISLKIYNSLGQEVRTIIDNAAYPEGRHTVQWDSRDNGGNWAASGVYIYKLIFGNFSKSKIMTLVR